VRRSERQYSTFLLRLARLWLPTIALKHYLSLLQSAALHAANPEGNNGSLQTERIAARIEDASLDDLIGQERRERENIRIPGCGRVLGRIAQDLRVMAEPVRESFAERLNGVLTKLPEVHGDVIESQVIERMTRGGDDGIHQFVIDVHKRLNALQREISEERIGAKAEPLGIPSLTFVN